MTDIDEKGMVILRTHDAQADLNEGFVFYEAQEPGLGDYFIACLRADIEGLKVSATTHRVVYANAKRIVLVR